MFHLLLILLTVATSSYSLSDYSEYELFSTCYITVDNLLNSFAELSQSTSTFREYTCNGSVFWTSTNNGLGQIWFEMDTGVFNVTKERLRSSVIETVVCLAVAHNCAGKMLRVFAQVLALKITTKCWKIANAGKLQPY